MAFSKAPRFAGQKAPSPGPATYSPSALGRPRVLAYTFGRPKKKAPKLRMIEITKLGLAEKLGSGGLGTVYAGHFGGKEAAVKVYRPQPGLLADPDQDRKALREEASMLQRVAHPHIVEAICLVSERGAIAGFCMERLGESFETASSQGHLCWQRLEKAFGQLVEAGLRV